MSDENDWDPAPLARHLLRNAQTGELGWLVRRNGATCVKLDNPRQDVTRRYVESEWTPEVVQRPLAPIHAAMVAFEADKSLCKQLGLHAHAKRSWDKLRDGERQLFMTNGPKAPPARAALYASVMAAMSHFVRA